MTRLPNTPMVPIPQLAHGLRGETKGVLIHTAEGSFEGTVSWFRNPNRPPGAQGTGAHALIGRDKCAQFVDLDAVCWHAAGANHDHVGWEHEAFAGWSKARWLLPSNRRMLRMSANRTAWACWHYKLGKPTKGRNVFAHADFPQGDHSDPGKGFPWSFYLWRAGKAYANLVASKGESWA